MYKSSVRQAYFSRHPHLWPFFALWRLTKLAALFGFGYGLVLVLFGNQPTSVLPAALLAAIAVATFGLVPASLLAVLDAVFVRRPALRPRKFNSRRHPRTRQNPSKWAAHGAIAGVAFVMAYAFVYVNAFDQTMSVAGLVEWLPIRAAAGGAAAGWLVAKGLNRLDALAPARNASSQIIRAAGLWAITIILFGTLAYLHVPVAQSTILPAVIFGVLGAGVIPHLASALPVDIRKIPPPQIPRAPSPGPTSPEGGSGEGARGDWRTAPPPPFPPNQDIGDSQVASELAWANLALPKERQ